MGRPGPTTSSGTTDRPDRPSRSPRTSAPTIATDSPRWRSSNSVATRPPTCPWRAPGPRGEGVAAPAVIRSRDPPEGTGRLRRGHQGRPSGERSGTACTDRSPSSEADAREPSRCSGSGDEGKRLAASDVVPGSELAGPAVDCELRGTDRGGAPERCRPGGVRRQRRGNGAVRSRSSTSGRSGDGRPVRPDCCRTHARPCSPPR